MNDLVLKSTWNEDKVALSYEGDSINLEIFLESPSSGCGNPECCGEYIPDREAEISLSLEKAIELFEWLAVALGENK